MNKSKKKLIIYPMLLVGFTAGLVGCKKGGASSSISSSETTDSSSSSISSSIDSSTSSSNISSDSSSTSEESSSSVQLVEVVSLHEEITIKNDVIFKYDYTSLFSITVDGESITVSEDMIDTSNIVNKEGRYEITCTYLGKTASCFVVVEKVEIVVVNAKVTTIEIKQKEVDSYDFTSLFSVTEKNRPVSITQDMISSTVKSEEGTYQVTCTYKNVSKSIEVIVTSSYNVEIFESYKNYELTLNELETFDYTKLFSIYVDGKFTPFNKDLIDTSEVVNPQVNDEFNISITFQIEDVIKTKTTKITIVDEKEVVVNAKNLVIYPNSKTIDLTTLFSVYEGGEKVNVTSSMITGFINYDKIGNNEITLSYKGTSKTCNVEVRKGVLIQYATSDKIVIKKGTNQSTYNFANDFIVSVNGTKFNLNNTYVDSSTVDFSTEGEYEAIITIPYGENSEDKTLTSYQLKITYVVTNINAVVNVKEAVVTLDYGTTSYNLLKNITSKVNGNNMIVTDNPEWATDPTCTYVEVVSDPIDFTKSGTYEVVINAYPYGTNEDPLVVSYQLVIKSAVVISEADKTTFFTGDSAYLKDMFVVTKNGAEVDITNDMVEGKVDFSTPGVYTLTLEYEGEKALAKVVVLDSSMKGEYSTCLTNIVASSSSSSSSEENNGYDESNEEEEEVIVKTLDKMVIDDNGIKSIDGKTVINFNAVDEKTINFTIGSFNYLLHYEDGVVICEPLNKSHMKYSDSNRPYVYFKDDRYEIVNSLTINSSTDHVFASSSSCSTIELIKVKDLLEDKEMYFGVKFSLDEVNVSDYFYSYEYSYLNDENNVLSSLVVGNTYKINFLGEDVSFKLESSSLGKIIRTDSLDRKYKNMTFTGLVDSNSAVLSFNEYQNVTLTVNDKKVFSKIFNEYASTKIGGIDYDTNTIKVYSETDGYSYIFKLNLEDKTFVVEEKTSIQGIFSPTTSSSLSSSFFFFDGYGKGLASGLDSAAYARNIFTYYEKDGMIYVNFVNPIETFEYKDGIVFRIDLFRNTLRVVSSSNSKMVDLIYVNQNINEGIYVTFDNNQIQMSESLTDSLEELYSYINIYNKDGLVTDESKSEYIDCSYVDFNQPGFYSVGIKTYIGEDLVYKYYGIQVLEPIYYDHLLMGNYSSITNSKYTFKFDAFGNCSVSYYNNSSDFANYKGSIIFTDETNFSFTGICLEDETKSITVTGKIEEDGIITLKIKGNKELNSYFIKEGVVSKSTGALNNYLRAFTNGDKTTFFYLTNIESTGEKVEVASINNIDPFTSGSIIKISRPSGEEIVTVKVLNWQSTYSGLQLSDSYKGEYLDSEGLTLSLDGFGKSNRYQGEAIIGENRYSYYLYNNEIVTLLDIENANLVGYLVVDVNSHSFTSLSASYADLGIVGDYGVLSYNGVSTSKHNFVIDEYGVGVYSMSSPTSSEEEYYSTSSSNGNYYGRIISINGNTYYFEGYILGKPDNKVQISFSKLGDSIINFTVNASDGTSDNVLMISDYDSIRFIGNNLSNYVTSVNIAGNKVYFYSEEEDSIPQIAMMNVIKGTYGEKGCIFSLNVGSKTVIEKALYTSSPMTTRTGYVFANNLKGTYTLSGKTTTLEIDGFGNIDYNTTGVAIVTAGTRVTEYSYEVFYDNIVCLSNGKTTIYYKLDTDTKTFTSISSTAYTGKLKGTYKEVNEFTSNKSSLTINGYSLATYSYGNSVYNCVVNHDIDNNTFTLDGDLVDDIYGSTISIFGKQIREGILELSIVRGSNKEVIYFIDEEANYSVYSGEKYEVSSGSTNVLNTIYKVDLGGNNYYLLTPTNKTTYGNVVEIIKEDDSPYELNTPGAIFKLVDGENTILVGKFISSSLNGGFIQANLDERLSFTSSDGHTLFTDGFTTSESNRGLAYFDNEKYQYYYSSALENTIILYNDNNQIKCYIEYNPDDSTFTVAGQLFEEDNILLRKFVGMYSSGNEISIDKFGYGQVILYNKVFTGKFTFDETFTNITFNGAIIDNEGTNVTCTIKVIKDGIVLLSSSGYENTTSYFTVGSVYMIGYKWENFIFSTTVDGTTTYLYAIDRSNNLEDYIGEVNIELYNPEIEFGKEGCIFIVKSLDNTIEYLTGRIATTTTNPGNNGYELADQVLGRYTQEGKDTLELDGFGNAKVGTLEGSYTFLNNLVIMVSTETQTYIYLIDTDSNTYVEKQDDKLKDKEYIYHKVFPNGDEADLYLSFDGRYVVNLSLKETKNNIGDIEAGTLTGVYTIENGKVYIRITKGSTADNIILSLDDIDNPTILICEKNTMFYINNYYFGAGSEFVLR